MTRVVSGLLAALAALGCAGAEAPRCGSGDGRPDVLLVVLDTVRADRTSTYGHHRATTIQLDAVAEAGVVFEDATAPSPWTYPSHASLFTGEPPWVHGAHLIRTEGPELGSPEDGILVSPLRRDLPTLAERFSEAGYRAVATVVNSWLNPELGITRGFETVIQHPQDGDVIAAARREIDADDPRPTFLFVNLLAAHSPFYEGPGPYRLEDRAFLDGKRAPAWVRPYLGGGSERRGVNFGYTVPGHEHSGVVRYLLGDLRIPEEDLPKVRQLYDAGVRAADYGLGKILERWVARHPDGVVAVTSDHGEALGEHGMLEHRSNVYSEVLRIPLVLAAPGCLPAGVRVKEPVMLQDLHPTLLDLTGIEPGAPGSLRAVLDGAPRGRPVVAAAWPDDGWARAAGGRADRRWLLYREGNDALVWSDAGDAELYDLRADPRMQRDRAGEDPARVTALRAKGERLLAENAAPAPKADRLEISRETRMRLEGLGYLDSAGDTHGRAPADTHVRAAAE